MQMACNLETYSARAINCGIGPKGLPVKSKSKPATITRIPLFANSQQTIGNSSSKNWASSIPITSASEVRSKMFELDGTGVLIISLP